MVLIKEDKCLFIFWYYYEKNLTVKMISKFLKA
jgi:hypothetical protein